MDDHFHSSTCQHLHELILEDSRRLVDAGHNRPGPRYFEAQMSHGVGGSSCYRSPSANSGHLDKYLTNTALTKPESGQREEAGSQGRTSWLSSQAKQHRLASREAECHSTATPAGTLVICQPGRASRQKSYINTFRGPTLLSTAS